MEYFGLFAFIMVLSYSALPGQLKRLKEEVRKLKHSMRGDNKMSDMLKELEGNTCKITFEGGYARTCEIIAVEEEWMKVKEINKNNESIIKIIRVENIKQVSML